MTSTPVYRTAITVADFTDAHVALCKLERALEQAAGVLSVISDHIELGTVNDNTDGLVAVAQTCQLAMNIARENEAKALNDLLDHIRNAGIQRTSMTGDAS